MHIYIYIHVYVSISIYIYIERECLCITLHMTCALGALGIESNVHGMIMPLLLSLLQTLELRVEPRSGLGFVVCGLGFGV